MYEIRNLVDRLSGKINVVEPANRDVVPVAKSLPRAPFLAFDMGRRNGGKHWHTIFLVNSILDDFRNTQTEKDRSFFSSSA
jgi:hypothetical protein